MMNFSRNKTQLMLLVLFFSASGAFAQLSEQQQSVMKPIEQLFEGMKKADTTLVIGAFGPQVSLMTAYRTKDGESKLHEGKLKEFIKAIAEKPAGSPLWLESISNPKVLIDDNMAQVWVDYKFHLDDKFTHCGVNAFQLVLLGGQWKIVQIIDTRRNTDCN